MSARSFAEQYELGPILGPQNGALPDLPSTYTRAKPGVPTPPFRACSGRRTAVYRGPDAVPRGRQLPRFGRPKTKPENDENGPKLDLLRHPYSSGNAPKVGAEKVPQNARDSPFGTAPDALPPKGMKKSVRFSLWSKNIFCFSQTVRTRIHLHPSPNNTKRPPGLPPGGL